MGRGLRARSAAIRERTLAGCLRLLAVLVAALALVGTADAAHAPRSPVIRAPTLLWKKFPLKQFLLVQRPASSTRGPRFLAAGPPPALALRAEHRGYGRPSKALLLVLLGSLTAAAVGFLLVRSALEDVADGAAGARQHDEERRRS